MVKIGLWFKWGIIYVVRFYYVYFFVFCNFFMSDVVWVDCIDIFVMKLSFKKNILSYKLLFGWIIVKFF